MEKRHPELYTDTDPKAMAAWIACLRAMTPADRMAATLQVSELALNMSRAGIRARHPEASEDEVLKCTAALHLPRDLMIAAYGWDPEQHGESN